MDGAVVGGEGNHLVVALLADHRGPSRRALGRDRDQESIGAVAGAERATAEVHLGDRGIDVCAECSPYDHVVRRQQCDGIRQIRSLAAERAQKTHLPGRAGDLEHEDVAHPRRARRTEAARELAHRPGISGSFVHRDCPAGGLAIAGEPRGPQLPASRIEFRRDALLLRLSDQQRCAIRRDRERHGADPSDTADPADLSAGVGPQQEGTGTLESCRSRDQPCPSGFSSQGEAAIGVGRERRRRCVPDQRQDVASAGERSRARERASAQCREGQGGKSTHARSLPEGPGIRTFRACARSAISVQTR